MASRAEAEESGGAQAGSLRHSFSKENMMKRPHRSLFILLIVLALSGWSGAQKLPEGAYHTNRERQYDIIHYKAEISFDFPDRRVFGKSTITLRPLRRLSSLALDAIHLDVKRVTDEEGKRDVAFRTTSHSLEITLSEAKGPYDRLTLVVYYECQPRAGMYFRPDPENPERYYVTTYGEGGLHANWLPIYNDVNDKFSTEMLITVPPPYVAISNGRLIETRSHPDGQKTYHWLERLPHANYLIALYVGDFEKGELAPAFGTIPIDFWVPRGRFKEGAYTFRNTTRMVEFFSSRFGYLYPWDKYDQIAVPDYAIGAMEHTTVTGHQASVLRDETAPLDFSPSFTEYTTDWTAESTIAHELAHHWFGDNLTCRNLSYIWLNESFASYCMMLWDEESQGHDQLLFDVELAKKHYFQYVRNEHIIRPLEYHRFDAPNEIYNTAHTYLKGAAVLHMLRRVLGDELFFRALRDYIRAHQFANVDSHDLKIAIEESTGKNLEWFFNQWVTGAGHPQLEVSYRYLAEAKLIDLTVKQVQPQVKGQGLFTLPATITVATPSRTWKEHVWIRKAQEQFVFPCEQRPLMVSFDGEGDLVAEIRFLKDIDELIYQAQHDAVPGRLRAIRQLVTRYPTDERTVTALMQLITEPGFWGVRAEAAFQLGSVRIEAAERAISRALQSADYRVRKAAVLALGKWGSSTAESRLKEVIARDPHTDVVGAAIVTLARMNPRIDPEIIKRQLGRKAWYDEITIACLQAFKELKDRRLVAEIKPYTGRAYNQGVRQAALLAWEACAPDDEELHRTLIGLLHSPVYALQQLAIQMLGRLHVRDAVEALNAILAQDADANLTVAARRALADIQRIAERPK